MHPVLMSERFIDRFLLQLIRDEEGDQVRDHERNDDGIIPRDLENHDHRSHGGPHDSREGRSHADQRIRAGRGRVAGQQRVRDAAHRAAHHRADEQGRPENSARVAGAVAQRRRHDLEHGQQHQEPQNDIAVERALHDVVAHAENFRNEKAHQPTPGRLPQAETRPSTSASARSARESEQKFDEAHRSQAAHHAQHRIDANSTGWTS